MNVVEINKYPPSRFARGRFLREDWTSRTDIGRVFHDVELTTSDYLEVEARYLRAVMRFVDAAGVRALAAHNVEMWEEDTDELRRVGLGDIIDGSATLVDGQAIDPSRLENVMRRCLREVAWMELVEMPRFLVHFGWDLRLIIATDVDVAGAIEETKRDGLFVYRGNTRLATLDAWAGLGA